MKKSKQDEQIKKPNKILLVIASLFIFGLIILSLSKMGPLGNFLNNLFVYLFGSLYLVVLITILAYLIYFIFLNNRYDFSVRILIGIIFVNLFVLIIVAYFDTKILSFIDLRLYFFKAITTLLANNDFVITGGVIGSFLYLCLYSLLDNSGVILFLVLFLISAILLIIPTSSYKNYFENLKINRQNRKELRIKEKEEAKKQKEEAEAERKLKLAEKMNEEFENENQNENNSVFVDLDEDEEVKDNKSVLSTKSQYFINLKDEEIHSAVETKSLNEGKDDVFKVNKVKRTSGVYHLPKPYENFLDPINNSSSNINKTSASVKGEKVIEILRNFGINAKLLNTYIGPSVTKFEIKPDSSVKINKIMNISDNIKMELAAKDIRIEAPIPGRSAVGIEIPNVEPVAVKMLDLIRSVPKEKQKLNLLFALGKDLMGKGVYCDLSKMPHLLIAGATGSGKSVCINTIITSYLLRTNPDDIKLVLVDPKKVEFTPYRDIPHLLWPIIDDSQMASNMLKKIVVIMEERYDSFASVGVRNIASFNEFVTEHNLNLKENEQAMSKLPYIVVIIDELADLMAIAGKEVELSIQRITQLARASGIHLIVATQRPSTDVITGLIKSNIPSRISFAVASSIDSRTILDQVGAERLLGNGDMLYYPQGENAPIRLQGVFVTDKEIQRICSFVKKQAKPEYEDSYYEFLTNMSGTTVAGASMVNADSQDSLYDDVLEYVKEVQKASTSLLQRRFGIGYNRAARLIDTLEDRGIIGPANGSKPREVYIKNDDE